MPMPASGSSCFGPPASIFRVAVRFRDFSRPRPSTSRALPGTLAPRRAAGSRSSPPAVDIASASVSNWRWPAISASSPRPASILCQSSVWDKSPDRAALRGLQKMIGVTRAKDIVMRSRRIPGHQAHEWGIATECVADAELEAATDRLVEELRGFPPLAQRTAKKLLNDIEDANLSLAIELEGQAYGRLRSSDDFREGVEAFHQKRRPKFTGR